MYIFTDPKVMAAFDGVLFQPVGAPYKPRLVPRALSVIGLVGGLLLISGYLAVLFGLIAQRAPLAGLSVLPIALFEFSLGVWLTVKGFNPSTANELLNQA